MIVVGIDDTDVAGSRGTNQAYATGSATDKKLGCHCEEVRYRERECAQKPRRSTTSLVRTAKLIDASETRLTRRGRTTQLEYSLQAVRDRLKPGLQRSATTKEVSSIKSRICARLAFIDRLPRRDECTCRLPGSSRFRSLALCQ